MTILVVATGNLGKLTEIQSYLSHFPLELALKPANLEIEESESTFGGNARLKASQVAMVTHQWAIADDSGLAVDALDGAPGVFSARYGTTDAERIDRLLKALANNPNRGAQFVCAIAIANPTGKLVLEAEGICRGEILLEPRGVNGFGYDPIFWVAEYGLSFAEMEPQLKAKTSHRGQAFAALLPQLEQKILNLDTPRSEETGILKNTKH